MFLLILLLPHSLPKKLFHRAQTDDEVHAYRVYSIIQPDNIYQYWLIQGKEALMSWK